LTVFNTEKLSVAVSFLWLVCVCISNDHLCNL